MEKKFYTLQEAAVKLGKSTQTIRRLIKRGDLISQRVKTPQGFHYVVRIEEPEVEKIPENEMLSDSTIQTPIQQSNKPQMEELKMDPPIQEKMLINQHLDMSQKKAENPVFDKMDEILKEIHEKHHLERMALIHVLEKLQVELNKERQRPRSLMGHIMDYFLGH